MAASQKNDSFAQLLSAWLANEGLTVRQGAERMGVSHQSIYNWIEGSPPMLGLLPLIQQSLKIPLEQLGAAVAVDRLARAKRLRANKRRLQHAGLDRSGAGGRVGDQSQQVNKWNGDGNHATRVATSQNDASGA